MTVEGKSKNKWQFGDFQTPPALAAMVLERLARDRTFCPGTVLEPSCGEGSFLAAAHRTYADSNLLGFDVSPDHVAVAKQALDTASRVTVQVADFFQKDWVSLIPNLTGPLLILGNPPWVTSSELGMLNSTNLPSKANFEGRKGIEAITGSSNFDISEWMLLRYVDWLCASPGKLAVLCKYSVARKMFRHLPKRTTQSFTAEIIPVDAMKYFGAAVEACLFILGNSDRQSTCSIFTSLHDEVPSSQIALRDSQLVRDASTYDRWQSLIGQDAHYVWRSGVKHDCSRVMELREKRGALMNGMDERVEIEPEYLFPLLKSSDVANHRSTDEAGKYMLVPQKSVGEATQEVAIKAPLTWRYLCQHGAALDARTSKVYQGKPRFAVFGVGDYSFAPWKVAISGFYKKLEFLVVGPSNGRPVIVDDTVYFLACESQVEAEFVASLLRSHPAEQLLQSLIFWDEKRPITARVLRQISLRNVAAELGELDQYTAFATCTKVISRSQLELGIAEQRKKYSRAVRT